MDVFKLLSNLDNCTCWFAIRRSGKTTSITKAILENQDKRILVLVPYLNNKTYIESLLKKEGHNNPNLTITIPTSRMWTGLELSFDLILVDEVFTTAKLIDYNFFASIKNYDSTKWYVTGTSEEIEHKYYKNMSFDNVSC